MHHDIELESNSPVCQQYVTDLIKPCASGDRPLGVVVVTALLYCSSQELRVDIKPEQERTAMPKIKANGSLL